MKREPGRPRHIIGMLAAAVVAVALCGGDVANADGDRDLDHDLARDLFRHGEIRALSDVLAAVHAATPGEIVAVSLIQDGSRWVYRFQVVTPDGRRSTVDVDAKSGTIIPNQGNGG